MSPVRVALLLVWLLPGLVEPAAAAQRPRAIARLTGLDGKPLGTATFMAVNRGVLIEFDLTGLQPGPHGIHLHVAGNCSVPSGFTAAGPILSLRPGRKHGYLAEDGPLPGDLPNQMAGADGRLRASVLTTAFTLGNGKTSIFDRDGTALILTQRGDDYRTQPLGNGGTRIACGVVNRTIGPAARKRPPNRPKSP